jgi:DNA-binding GntR family transcriptional regulator
LAPATDTRTLAERIADSIREGIVRGTFAGGEPLRQTALAERLGVSPIPVREALRQLEGEGFVERQPYRGAVVSPLSPEDALEIGDITAALHALALRLALPRLTDEVLDRAESLLEAARREANPSRAADILAEYAVVVYSPAGCPRLLALLRSVEGNWRRYARFRAETLRRPAADPPFQVIAALRRRDLEEAIHAVEGHYHREGVRLAEHVREKQGGAALS